MSNELFHWTDQLVRELGEWYHDTYGKDLKYWGPEVVDAFKQSKAPKTYEILTFRYTPNGALYTKANTSFNEAFCLSKPDCYQIHSVRRLSDGEVFTVGDRVASIGETFRITGFQVSAEWDGGLKVCSDEGPHAGSSLALLEKAPAPLFTTVDGKEVFEGDPYWAVQKKTFDLLDGSAYPLTFPAGWWTFSSREAAEEFVLLSKPLISVADLMEIWKLDDMDIEQVKGLAIRRL